MQHPCSEPGRGGAAAGGLNHRATGASAPCYNNGFKGAGTNYFDVLNKSTTLLMVMIQLVTVQLVQL